MTNWLSPDILAPEVHGAIGFGLLLALVYRAAPLWHPALPVGLGLFWVTVGLKEGMWDPVHETDQPFLWAGAWDLVGYLVGMAVAAAVILA